MRPKVLVLDEELPIPANTGKRIRTLNLLSHLASDFEIDLLVHATGATSKAQGAIRAKGITPVVAPSRLPQKNGLSFPLRILGNLLFSRLPYSVASHMHADYTRCLEAALAGGGYDLIHCEWTPYAHYLSPPHPPAVVSAHNVEGQIWGRLAQNATGARGLVFGVQARRMDAFESKIFAGADWVTAVSQGDAATIRKAGAKHVTVVPNGVDLDYFAPREPEQGHQRQIVFTGSMDWQPNQDAIRWFIEHVHPELSRLTDYRLLVVGRNPPAWMTGRGVPDSIAVTGTVDDVRPYITESTVYVTPLRAGGGSRLKILEALSMKKAVVSTTVGAEGLDVENHKHLILADDGPGFAARIVELMQDENRRRQLGEAGRELVQERYSWAGIAQVQAGLWRQAAADGSGAVV